MEDEVDRFGDVEKLDAIHVAELEGVVAQMLDVLQRSRIEIVKAYDPLSLTEQMLAKVRDGRIRLLAGASGADNGHCRAPSDGQIES